jgi:peptide/nickel transport system substrate-binding protein
MRQIISRSGAVRPVRCSLLALAAVCVAFVAGCGGVSNTNGGSSSPAGSSVKAPTSVTLVTSFAINNLDVLQNGFWGSEMGFGDLLMKPLGNGKLVPWLLESYSRTGPDTWKLTLRPDVKFQNGNALTASLLAQDMNFMLKHDTSLEPELPGAKVTADGPLTVRLTTATPTPFIPSLMADESMFDIVDMPVYLKDRKNPGSLLAARMYTGPYTPVSLTPQSMVMVPNKYYFGPKPTLTRLKILFVSDAQARVQAVENGEADVALYPPTSAAQELQGSTRAYFIPQQRAYENDDFEFIPNIRSGVLSETPVRLAIEHAVNYDQIADQVMHGYYEAPTGLFPSGVPYALHDLSTSDALASEELQSAGWKMGANGLRTKNGQQLTFTLLTYPEQPDIAPISLAMQSELKAVGINMQIRQLESSAMTTLMSQKTGWQAAIDGDTALDWTDSDPLEQIQSKFLPGGNNNYGGVDNPQLNQIYKQLLASESVSATDALLDRAQQIIVGEGYLFPVSFKLDPVVVAPAFRSFVVPHAALLWTNGWG